MNEATKANATEAPKPSAKPNDYAGKASEQAAKAADAIKLGRSSPKAPANQARDHCEMRVAGDVTTTIKSDSGSAVGTDYWMTDDEMRGALKTIAPVFGKRKSDAELEREVAASMNEDPRLMLLIINRGADGGNNGSLSLMPGDGSKYANIPFAPKSYMIAKGGVFGGNAKVGEFTAMLSLNDDFYGVDEPGELKITRFDKTGVAGAFTFRASARLSGTSKKITIHGTFDYPCTTGGNCM